MRPEGCDRVALVLQGGGALGPIRPASIRRCMKGASNPIGFRVFRSVLNAAIIAGNVPDQRLSRLRTFWELITDQKIWPFTVLAGARATAELLDVVWNYFTRSGCSRLSTASGLA